MNRMVPLDEFKAAKIKVSDEDRATSTSRFASVTLPQQTNHTKPRERILIWILALVITLGGAELVSSNVIAFVNNGFLILHFYNAVVVGCLAR